MHLSDVRQIGLKIPIVDVIGMRRTTQLLIEPTEIHVVMAASVSGR